LVLKLQAGKSAGFGLRMILKLNGCPIVEEQIYFTLLNLKRKGKAVQPLFSKY
jgi:hypothetical protein